MPDAGREDFLRRMEEQNQSINELFMGVKVRLPELTKLLEEADSHWQGEDGFYRFYHQSFKVYHLQQTTRTIVEKLRELRPGHELHPWFERIVSEGTTRKFEMEHNQRWLEETRPILEAFFHARTMLSFAVRYGHELDEPPDCMPSGWAAFLYLYRLR